jgi:hypothetical protein
VIPPISGGVEAQDDEAIAGHGLQVREGDREQFFSRENFAAAHETIAKLKAAHGLATADMGEGVVDVLEILETAHPLLVIHAHQPAPD